MILAAAVCPYPPLLVPDVAPGTGDELAALRAACGAAVSSMLSTSPERVLVIGPGDLDGPRDERAGGTLKGHGVDVRAGGPELDLPLSLTIGAWLLDRAGWTGLRTYVTPGAAPEPGERDVVLVMADGSARRSAKAPGALDERAEAFDATIAAALAGGDAAALTTLDPSLAEELWCRSVPTLQALGAWVLDGTQKGAPITAQLRVDEAPLGVGYFVADWVMA